MNTTKLIDAGYDLTLSTQNAPQGPPAGHHANRPVGSPASLYKAAFQGLTGLEGGGAPRGGQIPKTNWAQPELDKQQGFDAPGGPQIKQPSYSGMVGNAVKGFGGMVGGGAGVPIQGVSKIVGKGTDAMGWTQGAADRAQQGVDNSADALSAGWHQTRHPVTSTAYSDWENRMLKEKGYGPGDDLPPILQARDAVQRANPATGIVGAAGDITTPMQQMVTGEKPFTNKSPNDQILGRLTPEQRAAFDQNVQRTAAARAGGGQPTPDDIYEVEEAMLGMMQQGDKSWMEQLPGGEPIKAPEQQAQQPKPQDDQGWGFTPGWQDFWSLPPEEQAQAQGGAPPPPPPVPQAQPQQPNPAMQAGAEAVPAEVPQQQPSPEMQQGAEAAQAQAGPAGAEGQQGVSPEQQAGTEAARAQGLEEMQGGAEALRAQGPQLDPAISGLIWEGPPDKDAYKRALEQPMDQEQFMSLLNAANDGQIPQEQIPRVVQQLIATDSVDKAMQMAQEQGISPEQALGQIAEQRAGGEFDEQDISTAFETLLTDEASKSIEQKAQAGDPTATQPGAVEAEKEKLKQEPSMLDRLMEMWDGMDNYEKTGLVVGVVGSVIALVNGMMGGNGMTTIASGALGLGGLGYAFGGGDMLKGMFGGDQKQAPPDATADIAGRTNIGAPDPQAGAGNVGNAPVPGATPEAQAGTEQGPGDPAGPSGPMGDAAAPGTPAGQAATPESVQATMGNIMSDNKVEGGELLDALKQPGMFDAASDQQITQLLQGADYMLSAQLYAASMSSPEMQIKLGQQFGLNPQQSQRLFKLYKAS